MDASLFNEKHADIIVRAVALLHGNNLINKGDRMQFVKADDGSIHQVIESTAVTRAELEERVHQSAVAHSVAKEELAAFDRLTTPKEVPAEQPTETATPVEAAPVEQPQRVELPTLVEPEQPPVPEVEAPEPLVLG